MMEKIFNYLTWVLFILGFGTFIFTRLSKLVPTIPIAILISFILILRFSRIKKNNWLTFLGFLLSINIGLWGLFELGSDISSLMFNIIRSSLLALLYFLPFMIDKYIYPKCKDKWYSTLVFPIITTAIFYVLTIEGPFEGDIQPAKFAFGILIFKQFLSLFGSLGFVFLTSWLASVVNYVWENEFDWKKIRKITYILSSVIIIIILFGTIKVHMLPKADTVKVAAIIIDPDWGKETSMEKVFADRITSSFEETLVKIEDKTKIAASNDAKIASFMENTLIIDEEDQDDLREELKRIAQENNIYLTITYGYYVKDGKGKNIHLLIDNNGEILLDYQKRYLAGIGELAEKGVFVIGPEIIQSVDTPYGKIGLSICRDMEMSKFIIQAAKADVDIMFSSAYEWPKTWLPNNLQTPIVNGFSLVRPAYNGVTHIQDYNGKILGEMYFEDTDTGILYADVPTKGVKTLYSYVGKLIGWLSALGLLTLTVLPIINRKREK